MHNEEANGVQRYRLHRFYTILGILLCEKYKETCLYASDVMKAVVVATLKEREFQSRMFTSLSCPCLSWDLEQPLFALPP